MPELPEVEVVRAGLAPVVAGASITAVEVFDERSLRRHRGPVEGFADGLVGARFSAAVRRGKFLWLPLELTAGSGDDRQPPAPTRALVAHLGMSGQVLLRSSDAPPDRLQRIRIAIDSPTHGRLALDFVDQRIFGSMAVDALLPTADAHPGGHGDPAATVPSQVAHIARDPLDPHFDSRRFFEALAKKNVGIKRVLLDQTLISGIGNIYADESLWAARIHFDQPARELSRVRARTLLAEVRSVLARALADGGTSFDAQYVNVNGASGYFSQSLSAYGRHGQSCSRCGGLIVRESFMNRGSHFCPLCQRLRPPRVPA